MSEKRNMKWSQVEESKLIALYYAGSSYQEMAKELGRTWYACKCRLMKLKLVPVDRSEPVSIEKYTVPLPKKLHFEFPSTEIFGTAWVGDDTSHTFSDEELNIVLDYLKSRLAKLALQKIESVCYQKNIDIDKCEDIFKTEIAKVKQFKSLTSKQREKYLTRIA